MLNQKWMEMMHGDSCGCGCGCGCSDHDHDQEFHEVDENIGETSVIMVDEETGEEYEFLIVDEFDFEEQTYCVLLTMDEEPEPLIVKVQEGEDGMEYYVGLEEEEFEKVSAEYDRLLDEIEDEEDSEESDA